MFSTFKHWRERINYPQQAKDMLQQDKSGLQDSDPGNNAVIDAAVDWLCLAQDSSLSNDGGVSRNYSLINGWNTSYPETTGYIIPTLINVAHLRNQPYLLDRAKRMLDWCASIQLADGGFQGGRIDAKPIVPVTFNTGQILLGLAAGVTEFDSYHNAMHKAARFLRDSLDPDGCWRKHPTPFAEVGEKAYETHVSWGLFEADRVAPEEGYADAGFTQIQWALSKQQKNGWVEDCCLTNPEKPLTHTLGYFLKGLIEAHRFSNDEQILEASIKTANGLLTTQRPDGSLPGRLKADWSPAVSWSCLTGNIQIADSWFYLYKTTDNEKYLNAGLAANSFVRKTIIFNGDKKVVGGVKGAFPVNGDYGAYEFLNWAAKFTIDSCISEQMLNI